VFVPLAAAAAGLGAVYAIGIERHWWATRRFTVACLPPGAGTVRILHVSDIHFRRGQGLKRRFLASLAVERPDLIVATGDLLGDAASVDAIVGALDPIHVAVAKLVVLGSNDYYSPTLKNPLHYFWQRSPGAEPIATAHASANPWRDLVAGLVAHGWTYLSNERTTLTVPADDGSAVTIEVVGLDDAHIGRARPEAATPRDGGGFRLAVAHSPDSIADLISKEYDLILAGHTHGGQVRMPGYGALVTNCDIPRAWARGLHRSGRSWIHVSAGLGTSMYAPYRFACRPEVSVLTLVPRDGKGPAA
jgi:predicted MPP superfamily phosphohydrolase